jgi:hypothetical protein
LTRIFHCAKIYQSLQEESTARAQTKTRLMNALKSGVRTKTQSRKLILKQNLCGLTRNKFSNVSRLYYRDIPAKFS